MYRCKIDLTFHDDTSDEIKLDLTNANQMIINRNLFNTYNLENMFIKYVNIKIKCKDFFNIEIYNDFSADVVSLSSYGDYRSSIASIKIHNISGNFNNLDINHFESYYSSPNIVRCNIKDLYTGCEFFGNSHTPTDEYKVEIHRDSHIDHYSANGFLTLNIQESTIKECDFHRSKIKKTDINKVLDQLEETDYLDINKLKGINIWNGSNINLLKISTPTEKFKVSDSIITTLSLGPDTDINEIILNNEIITQCSLLESSIRNDSIEKWRLIKKTAAQKGDRNLYLRSAYRLNKCYTKKEKNKFKKLSLIFFSALCGYGYRPFRTILASLLTILLFGCVFWFVYLCDSQSLYFTRDIFSFFNCIYFSGITFATIGFGDILPNVLGIKIVAIIEGMIGVGMLSLFIFSLTKTLTEHIKD